MSKIYRLSIIGLESFLYYIIMQLIEYAKMTILEQTAYVVLGFMLISYLEMKGVNHKICKWIGSIFLNKVKTLSQEVEEITEAKEKYISLSEAIKFLADKGASGENILTENELTEYREDRYRSVALHEPDLVPMELWLILKKVDNKDMILYGRNPLQSDGGVLVEIPSVPYYAYNVENWSDDWQEMKYESGKIIYKDLQVDKADLEANLPITKIE